jgi:hypothetical protein
MSLSEVNINIENGQIGGLATTTDGVCALIGNGVAVTDKIALAVPELLFTLQDAISKGLSEAENPAAYKQIKEFYDVAGPSAELWVMLVSDATPLATMLDNTNNAGLRALVLASNGRVAFWGAYHAPAPGYVPDLAGGVDADVLAAIGNAQILNEAFATLQQPLRGIIHGYGLEGDNAASAATIAERTDNRVAVVASSSSADGSAGVGAFIGTLASIPVQRKASRVRNGSLPWAKAYIGAVALEDVSALSLLADKGYIVARTFPTRSGYYWGNDRTCAPTTDDYFIVARGRTIDKAQRIAYDTYINELDDEVPVNADGTLDGGFVATIEANIEQQIGALMADEISSVIAVVDPAQNVIASNQTNIELRIIPVGYNSAINVSLGFSNPFN